VGAVNSGTSLSYGVGVIGSSVLLGGVDPHSGPKSLTVFGASSKGHSGHQWFEGPVSGSD